jgi:hypothetical protein
MAAILPSAVGVFARLVDEGHVGKVTLAFEEAIAKSFETHPMRHLTKSEVDRRFEMVAKIFTKLRADLKWGIDRALAHLSEYLGAELSGSSWTPDTRSCWMPEDGRN